MWLHAPGVARVNMSIPQDPMKREIASAVLKESMWVQRGQSTSRCARLVPLANIALQPVASVSLVTEAFSRMATAPVSANPAPPANSKTCSLRQSARSVSWAAARRDPHASDAVAMRRSLILGASVGVRPGFTRLAEIWPGATRARFEMRSRRIPRPGL
jgi:hypothetical protein